MAYLRCPKCGKCEIALVADGNPAPGNYWAELRCSSNGCRQRFGINIVPDGLKVELIGLEHQSIATRIA